MLEVKCAENNSKIIKVSFWASEAQYGWSESKNPDAAGRSRAVTGNSLKSSREYLEAVCENAATPGSFDCEENCQPELTILFFAQDDKRKGTCFRHE